MVHRFRVSNADVCQCTVTEEATRDDTRNVEARRGDPDQAGLHHPWSNAWQASVRKVNELELRKNPDIGISAWLRMFTSMIVPATHK